MSNCFSGGVPLTAVWFRSSSERSLPVGLITSCRMLTYSGAARPAAVRSEPKDAIRALRKFPSIGEPGAEKILLFSGSAPVLALDSNALRVLLRLGFGEEEKSYSKSYKAAQAAADSEIPRTCSARIEAYQLLRRHGQELCKRNHPRCEACPLRPGCVYYRTALEPGR